MKQIIITFIATLCTTLLFAQAPQAFNYQGVARDLSGNPIPDQNIGLQIAILQGSASGTEVYKEIHNATTTDLGLFNLQIGTGTTVSGNFENISWGNDSHFLQIGMDENGGSNYQLIGTSELLSVPYALYADNGSKWGNNSSGIDYKDGYVGIGTQDPQSTLHVVEENDDAILILEADINDNNEENNPRIEFLQDGGYSNSAIGLNLLGNDIENAMYIANTTSDRGGIHLATDNTSDTWTSSMIRMTIATDGNVGIGVIEPQSTLHVVEENDDAVLILEADINDNNEENNPRIEFLQDGGYSNSAIGLNLLGNDIENAMYIANTTSDRGGIHLATDNTSDTWTSSMIRMTIATDGNVGIGVVEPKAKLQVSDGDIYIADINNGVIMKSPNGQCWRMTVNNSGQPEFNSITCPN